MALKTYAMSEGTIMAVKDGFAHLALHGVVWVIGVTVVEMWRWSQWTESCPGSLQWSLLALSLQTYQYQS